MQKILLLAGDFTEDYETMVPFQALSMLGYQVDAVCPGKKAGEVDFDDYIGLFITGGRSPEYIRMDHKVISLVKCFVRSGKPVAAICHAAQVLTAADVVCGRKLTCYPALAAEVKLAGGNYIEVAPDEAVVDCNLITSPAWPGNTAILREFAKALGCEFIFRP